MLAEQLQLVNRLLIDQQATDEELQTDVAAAAALADRSMEELKSARMSAEADALQVCEVELLETFGACCCWWAPTDCVLTVC